MGEASEWADITTGVPQGSVLGPLLSIIYINYIDNLTSRIATFSDDTKLGTNTADLEAIVALRKDLIKIRSWSKKWQMPFNCGKCKVMHIGDRNAQSNYSFLDNVIESVDQEEDLGILTYPQGFKVHKTEYKS